MTTLPPGEARPGSWTTRAGCSAQSGGVRPDHAPHGAGPHQASRRHQAQLQPGSPDPGGDRQLLHVPARRPRHEGQPGGPVGLRYGQPGRLRAGGGDVERVLRQQHRGGEPRQHRQGPRPHLRAGLPGEHPECDWTELVGSSCDG